MFKLHYIPTPSFGQVVSFSVAQKTLHLVIKNICFEALFIYFYLKLRVVVGDKMFWTHCILDIGMICFSRMMVAFRPGFKNFVKSSGS